MTVGTIPAALKQITSIASRSASDTVAAHEIVHTSSATEYRAEDCAIRLMMSL
ncbi:hypothetical protein HYPSUDRAFT_46485 [Hypholoma sublateritium FD-334 SS-4]|uniref:Uncharacterized protein n=1 Tax=Hypholoma sublateritium (strain FD-334 SS-4) TaxID=945553 RepID=A0A0D2M2J8_HYPSF|nr:hypothetical protein HYPSUDRAFT_46485 [Hypholoma sublateritium FD-334 SS-4]